MVTPHSRDERGASSVEYALVLTGIAAVLVIVIFSLGGVTDSMFETTCTEFDKEAKASASC